MTTFVIDNQLRSWGRVHRYAHHVARPSYRDELPGLVAQAQEQGLSLLPVGFLRSYGDSCLNDGGALINMSRLDRLISFDPETGDLKAEAGVSLRSILAFAVPRGFFLPVVPGTQMVTLGGAVANDVHGKNHLHAGTFGDAVVELDLLRTDGSCHRLNRENGAGLFEATIGGLGLTGIITAVTVRLARVRSAMIEERITPFDSLAEFFALAEERTRTNVYTVAWIDGMAGGSRIGRGLFLSANHAEDGDLALPRHRELDAPSLPHLARRLPVAMYNRLHLLLAALQPERRRLPYDRFFFPLDSIAGWNRLYGARGLYQYQSVVPPQTARDATAAMLHEVAAAGHPPFLGVLKTFGAKPSPGLLSFPMEGTTLALDFPNEGEPTLALLKRLDAIVHAAGGRLNPAKEARAEAGMFRLGYPRLESFLCHLDPGAGSSFLRRMVT